MARPRHAQPFPIQVHVSTTLRSGLLRTTLLETAFVAFLPSVMTLCGVKAHASTPYGSVIPGARIYSPSDKRPPPDYAPFAMKVELRDSLAWQFASRLQPVGALVR